MITRGNDLEFLSENLMYLHRDILHILLEVCGSQAQKNTYMYINMCNKIYHIIHPHRINNFLFVIISSPL